MKKLIAFLLIPSLALAEFQGISLVASRWRGEERSGIFTCQALALASGVTPGQFKAPQKLAKVAAVEARMEDGSRQFTSGGASTAASRRFTKFRDFAKTFVRRSICVVGVYGVAWATFKKADLINTSLFWRIIISGASFWLCVLASEFYHAKTFTKRLMVSALCVYAAVGLPSVGFRPLVSFVANLTGPSKLSIWANSLVLDTAIGLCTYGLAWGLQIGFAGLVHSKKAFWKAWKWSAVIWAAFNSYLYLDPSMVYLSIPLTSALNFFAWAVIGFFKKTADPEVNLSVRSA